MPTMLPAAPKTLGRLSDVFVSALGSIIGKSNRLGFKSANRVCVVLVDGLGSENIRAAGGHAPFLNSALKNSKSINTVFPTTTAAAITSFGVGASPSRHGVFGYSVFDRKLNQTRNLLSGWSDEFLPGEYQSLPSIASLAVGSGIKAFSIGPAEYADSGFTALNMSGAEYLAAKSFEDRVEAAEVVLKAKHRSITYLYFPELDSIAHSRGVSSVEWLNKLEELDGAIKTLVSSLSSDSAVVLTADHGVVDVAAENQIMLDEMGDKDVVAVTGDPRNTFVYFADGIDIDAKKELYQEFLGDQVVVADSRELTANGWFESSIENEEFLPDLFLISRGEVAVYHRQFAKPQSLRMIGQHGSFSQTELSVPLLKFGAYAS